MTANPTGHDSGGVYEQAVVFDLNWIFDGIVSSFLGGDDSLIDKV